MEKLRVDVLPADLENFKWLQLSAVLGAKVVGTATVYWLGVDGKAPELCNLFVRPAARRRGVAKALLAATAKHLKRPFCLNAKRESPAYWLYRKLGFLEVGIVKEKEGFVWMMSGNNII